MALKLPNSTVSIVLASYLKRWLSTQVYDRAFDTDIGHRLSELSRPKKHAIEAGLYALTALFDAKFKDNTILRRIIREVGSDMGPEISKRLLDKARETLRATRLQSDAPEMKSALNLLLDLEDTELRSLLDSLYNLSQDKRSILWSSMATLSPEQIGKLANMEPSQLETLAGLNAPLEPLPHDQTESDKPTASELLNSDLKSIASKLEAWIDRQKKGEK